MKRSKFSGPKSVVDEFRQITNSLSKRDALAFPEEPVGKLPGKGEAVLLDAVVRELNLLAGCDGRASQAVSLQMGRVLSELYDRHNPTGKARSETDVCRMVSKRPDCRIGYSQLQNHLGYFRLWRALGGERGKAPNVSMTHYVAVLPDKKKPIESLAGKRKYLGMAAKGKLSVSEMKAEIEKDEDAGGTTIDWSKELDLLLGYAPSRLMEIEKAMREAGENPLPSQINSLEDVCFLIHQLFIPEKRKVEATGVRREIEAVETKLQEVA